MFSQVDNSNSILLEELQFTPVTPEKKHCFFGYYDVSPWSSDRRRLLVTAATFIDRLPANGDKLELMVRDLSSSKNEWTTFAITSAWNWQMGCRLQWMPGSNSRVLYNDKRDGAFCSIVRDLDLGSEKLLPMPVFALSHDGRSAVTLNFSRLHDVRPGYGYHGLKDKGESVIAPEDDGIFVFNIDGGAPNLILSYAQILSLLPDARHRKIKLWVNHLFWSPEGRQILIFARVSLPEGGAYTYLFLVDRDGSHPNLLAHSKFISHFDWREADKILVYAEFPGYPMDYYFIDTSSGRITPVAPCAFDSDGHCSLSPDGKWMLTDTYPNPRTGTYSILLLQISTGIVREICRVKALDGVPVGSRCDLHPRWRSDGRQIAFDAAPQNIRRMFLCDLDPLLNKAEALKIW